MGRSLSTNVVYGYDIGSVHSDDGWKFEEFDASEYKMMLQAFLLLMPVYAELFFWAECDECDWGSENTPERGHAEHWLDKYIREEHS